MMIVALRYGVDTASAAFICPSILTPVAANCGDDISEGSLQTKHSLISQELYSAKRKTIATK